MAVFAVGDARSGSVKWVGAAIEAATGLRAKCNFMAMQQGDVPVTFADTFSSAGFNRICAENARGRGR
jgi:hypothetical protein